MSEAKKSISRNPVTSSNVKSIGIYRYEQCTQEKFDALIKANDTEGESVGKLIHQTIKPKKFKKL